MKIAIISDIHSNIEALDAVFTNIDAAGVDQVISLGDNVGYGADPEAVIQRLISRNVTSTLGNHELALLSDDYLKSFNKDAAKAIKMHRKLLSSSSLDFIARLPRFIVRHGCRFVHALPPDSIIEYVSRTPETRVRRIVELQKQPMSFVGHTHLIMWFELKNNVLHRHDFSANDPQPLHLQQSIRYLINAGSTGQPRDSSWKAKYVVWDMDKNLIIPHYVKYDNKAAAHKIQKMGIAPRFAQQLMKSLMR